MKNRVINDHFGKNLGDFDVHVMLAWEEIILRAYGRRKRGEYGDSKAPESMSMAQVFELI